MEDAFDGMCEMSRTAETANGFIRMMGLVSSKVSDETKAFFSSDSSFAAVVRAMNDEEGVYRFVCDNGSPEMVAAYEECRPPKKGLIFRNAFRCLSLDKDDVSTALAARVKTRKLVEQPMTASSIPMPVPSGFVGGTMLTYFEWMLAFGKVELAADFIRRCESEKVSWRPHLLFAAPDQETAKALGTLAAAELLLMSRKSSASVSSKGRTL